MSEIPPVDYAGFLVEIKERIRRGQYQALRAANKELLELYWDIGAAIHKKQESLGWGKSVVETLARDLQDDFPGRNGFSARNLWNMRGFYAACSDKPISATTGCRNRLDQESHHHGAMQGRSGT